MEKQLAVFIFLFFSPQHDLGGFVVVLFLMLYNN